MDPDEVFSRVALCSAFLLVTCLAAYIKFGQRTGRRSLLRGRTKQTMQALWAAHYRGSGILRHDYESAWLSIAVALHVDPGLLLPGDQLDDLAGVPKWLVPWDHPIVMDAGRLKRELLEWSDPRAYPSSVQDVGRIRSIDQALRFVVGAVLTHDRGRRWVEYHVARSRESYGTSAGWPRGE